MKLWSEFRKFIARGNLMDLAVGIMIGGAFSTIVQSLVKDILTPIIGVFLGRRGMSEWVFSFEVPATTATGEPTVVNVTYGNFLQSSLDFLVLAFVIFFIVKAIARLKRKAEDETNPEVPTPKDIELLAEIRDLLKQSTGSAG